MIAITGCAGFIGSHFLKYVWEQRPKEKIVGIDLLTYAGNVNNIPDEIFYDPRFTFVYGDIRDRDLMRKYLTGCDYCIGFAAMTHVTRSIYNTNDFVDVDVKGTQILLDVVRDIPIKRFVHISTSEVYGTLLEDPMTETHPLNPHSPYAASKCGADRLCYAYWNTFKMPIVIIRPFNNYGPNQHPEKLIPNVITRLLDGGRAEVFGDGKMSRDWLHVDDTVRGVYAAMMTDGIDGEVINLATNRSINVRDITMRIGAHMGSHVESNLYTPCEARLGEVIQHKGSNTKAYKLLGWKPEVEFEDGLKDTITWYKNNEEWWKDKRVVMGRTIA